MSELKNKDNFQDFSKKPPITMTVGENEYNFLPQEESDALDNKLTEIRDFMTNNDGKGKTNEEKDSLYAEAQKLWNEYSQLLNDAQFGLVLNKSQYIYMTNLLLEKMEYDVNLLFFAIELTNMLGNMKMKKDAERYKNDTDCIVYSLTATDITYLYHVLQQHKVKGLKQASFTFAEIIRRIGDISKIFSYYDNESKELSTEIQDWVVGFEESVKGETVEPVKEETE
jgi:hypothetical protein